MRRASAARQQNANDLHPQSSKPALLFDLDGTLLDSNYEHVIAWRLALRHARVELPNAFLHRCIGMSGQLLIEACFKEVGRKFSSKTKNKLEKLHRRYFERTLNSITPLPGAASLLKALSRRGISWAIATGGDKESVQRMIRALPIPAEIPVITADHVEKAKPEPDVFLAGARRLGMALSDCIVVGDSVWDLLAARRPKRWEWHCAAAVMVRLN